MTHLSCHRSRCNLVQLALSLLAYNLRQFVAATGTDPTNRELVAHESAATFGEDRRTVGQARLAAAAGRPSESVAVRTMLGQIALLPVAAG
jgi:hypothetical protein